MKKNIYLICLLASFSLMGQVSGIVFRDFNLNGIKDNIVVYNEPPLGGITITVYDANGIQVGTMVSAIDGSYLFSGLVFPVRVEFSGYAIGDHSSVYGTGSQSSVQFYNAPTSTAHFGVNYPSDFCHTQDPKMVTTRFVNGNTSATGAGETGTFDALLGYNYSSSGTTLLPNSDATAVEVGSVWGIAYNRTTKKAFTSAFIKRHMGLGPLGIGGIYVADYSGGSDPVISPFMNVDGLAGIDVGSIGTNTDRNLSNNPQLPNHDPEAFPLVGKASLGDIDLSEDGNTLYVTNLFQQKIIVIDLTTYNLSGTIPSTATQLDIPATVCNNGVDRPWALKSYRGKLYLGVTCTGENGGTVTDLTSFVYSYDGTAWTLELEVPLDYNRWYAFNIPPGQLRPSIPWVDLFSSLATIPNGGVTQVDNAQLLLTDIEFDVDGSMIIGYVDRTGLQLGNNNYTTDTNNFGLVGCFSNGDILRAYYNGSSYVLESNGVVGGLTGLGSNANYNWPYSGPDGGEFYAQEMWGLPLGGHTETSYGGLALLPGKQEVALTAMDPNDYSIGGIAWLSNINGNQNKGYQLYNGTSPTFFGKAVGLGDVEILCDSAPLEIGNRVWEDDGNGIQDPDELPLAGVVVELYDMTTGGTLVGTTITNVDGQYYFGGSTNLGMINGILRYNNNYEIRISVASADAASPNTITSITPSDMSDDLRDSDGILDGTIAKTTFITGTSGQNDHTYDFGFIASAICGISIINVTPSACDQLTNTYSLSVEVQYSNDPGGNIVINASGITQSFSSSGTGTETFTLTGLPANGLTAIDVSASFEGDPSCMHTLLAAYNAPAACSLACNISVEESSTTPSAACDPANPGKYLLTLHVIYSNLPGTDLLIDGNIVTTDGSGDEVFIIAGYTADGAPHSTTVSAFDDPLCTYTTSSNAYIAPTLSSCNATTNPCENPSCSPVATLNICNDGSANETLSVDPLLTNVIWYNSTGQQVGIGNTIEITTTTLGMEDGTECYYSTSIDGTCTATGCCPVNVISELCCPAINCINISVIQQP